MKPDIDYTLYLVTDRELMSSATIEESVEQAIRGGCTLVQLREKNASSRAFYETAVKVREVTARLGVPLIINDRVDIALAVNADGVHVGQGDLPAEQVRRIIGPDRIVGVSACNLTEALAAVEAGADYLGVGAMYSTGTKTDADIVTTEELLRIREAVTLPIVVIGGISKETIPNFRGMGIDGLAVVSAIVAQEDVAGAARELKTLFRDENRQIKAYIFDLDGTLLDSMGVWEQIDVDFLTKRGFEVPPDYLGVICSQSFPEAASYTIERFGLPDSVDDLLREWNSMAFYAYGHTVALKPYALEYLTALKKQGVKLGIATSLPAALYEPALRNHGIRELFDVICSTDEVSCGKTRPDIFYLAAQKLGVDPSECIVFEDIPQAVQSAKEAGMTVYGVYDESSKDHWAQIKQMADGVLYDFKDAPLPK